MQAPPLHAMNAGDKLTMTFHKNPKPAGFLQHHQGGAQAPVQGGPAARAPMMPMSPTQAQDPKAMLLAALASRR